MKTFYFIFLRQKKEDLKRTKNMTSGLLDFLAHHLPASEPRKGEKKLQLEFNTAVSCLFQTNRSQAALAVGRACV